LATVSPPRRLAAPGLLPALLLVAASAASADPPAPAPASDLPPLPAGVIARVLGRDVTRAEFHRHLAQRLRVDLQDPKSPASTTLRMAIEEVVVAQEAARLGVAVTKADVDARYAEIDAAVRQKSNGETNLADLMKLQQTPIEEFRHNLFQLVSKERVASHPDHLGPDLPKDENARLAQIEVVTDQLMSRSRIERDGLPEGVVVRVNGQPIDDEAFGRALDLRTHTAPYLAEYVQALLLRDLALTEEAFDRALQKDRLVYERVRLLDPRPETQAVSFEEYLRARHGRGLDELRHDPYFRGLLALKERFRAEVTDDDVIKEWTAKAKSSYGPVLQVLDVVVSFRLPNAVFEPVARRSKEEAQAIAAEYARRLRGADAEKALAEIRGRRTPEGRPDRSVQAVHRALRNDETDGLLFEAASKVEDGQWTPPFETLSEVHVVRRDRLVPAPTFEQAKELVRHDLVVFRANRWLSDQLRDPTVVRIATSK
jgi:hypothetical protein